MKGLKHRGCRFTVRDRMLEEGLRFGVQGQGFGAWGLKQFRRTSKPDNAVLGPCSM